MTRLRLFKCVGNADYAQRFGWSPIPSRFHPNPYRAVEAGLPFVFNYSSSGFPKLKLWRKKEPTEIVLWSRSSSQYATAVFSSAFVPFSGGAGFPN